MADAQKTYSGQAQHLADWKARQKRSRGYVLYLPVQTRVTQEEACSWQEKVMDKIGKFVLVLALVLGAAVTIVQLGFEKGWW